MLYVTVALVFFGIVVMIMTRANLVSSLVETMLQQDRSPEGQLNEAAPLIIYAAIVDSWCCSPSGWWRSGSRAEGAGLAGRWSRS